MKKGFLALLLLIVWIVAEAGDAPAYRIAVPAGWLVTTRDDVTTFRNAAGTQMLTAATYTLLEPSRDDAQRRELALRSIAARRALETARNDGVILSAVRIRPAGGLLQMRYSGADPHARRHFVDVTIAAHDWLQHFHYEALGLEKDEFERNAERVLRDAITRAARDP